MPKSTTRRIIKKKQQIKKKVKKSQQKTQANPQEKSTIKSDNSLQNQLTESSLCSKLIARGFSGIGFFPQQNGNMNSADRIIRELQNKNQSTTHQISDEKTTIDSLNKENEELKEKAKSIKKGLSDLEHDKRLLEVELKEAERVGKNTDILKQQIKYIENQIKETKVEECISDLRKEKRMAEEKQEQERDINRAKKLDVEKNKLFHELSNIKRETDRIVAENNGLQEIIESDDFINPNKAFQNAYKERQKELNQNELLRNN